MTFLDILLKAGLATEPLLALLKEVKEKLPDLAPTVDKYLAALSMAVDPESLISLAEALPKELANIAKGDFDPRRHPSDVA